MSWCMISRWYKLCISQCRCTAVHRACAYTWTTHRTWSRQRRPLTCCTFTAERTSRTWYTGSILYSWLSPRTQGRVSMRITTCQLHALQIDLVRFNHKCLHPVKIGRHIFSKLHFDLESWAVPLSDDNASCFFNIVHDSVLARVWAPASGI